MLESIRLALENVPPEVKGGAIFAMTMAVLRVVYDQEETKPIRVITEAFICGGLSVAVSYMIQALGLNVNWAVFAGGAIGFMGSMAVRKFAMAVMKRKADKL